MKKKLIIGICSMFMLIAGRSQEENVPTPQWRPLWHFTPEKNWTNDPNGLIYLNGVYHLYNQQNPFENKWGHMSWGHATSTDLIHWKHLPIAMPETIDKDTTWRFSGCAVWDKNNTSGFCSNGPCIVAIYTADQPNLKKESQYVAYSNDGGLTLTNYAGNPVIDLQRRDFRDPNVTWNDQLGKWVMVVAMPRDHAVRFYASPNLKNWELLSEFGGAGYDRAHWECPSLIQLPVEGSSGKKKWVLLVSAGGPERGPYMQYFVGEFDGKVFKNDNPPDKILSLDEGDCFYAAIPWNNTPGDNKILIGWMVPGPQHTYPWRGQMSIARDLSLRETSEGLRLVQKPAKIITDNLPALSGNNISRKKDLKASNTEVLIQPMPGNSYWLDALVTWKAGTNFGFKIAQKKGNGQAAGYETLVGYDSQAGRLYVDRTHSGTAKMDKNKLMQSADLKLPAGSVRVQILFDKSSLEVFFKDGEKVLTCYVFPDADANLLSFFASRGEASLSSLTIYDLSAADSR